MIICCILMVFLSPEKTLPALTDSSMGVLKLCVDLLCVYSIWMGLLEIVDKSGLGDKIAKFLMPIIKRLFKTRDKEALKNIAMNISANILGLGNASTPSGINAIKCLDKGETTATSDMIMLIIINACSIQILPTTAIGLRSAAGSTNPTDTIIPTIVVTTCVFIIGIFLTKLCEKMFFRGEKNRCNK